MTIKATKVIKEIEKMAEKKDVAGTPLAQLTKSTLKFENGSGDRKAKADTRELTKIQLEPFIGTKVLEVRSAIKSAKSTKVKPGTGSEVYKPTLRFFNVVYQDHKDKDFTYEIKDTKTGKTWYIIPIDFSRDNAQVKCTCWDYKWRFEWWNDKDFNAHLGKAKNRSSEVKGTGKPVNPNQIPGICKHLYALIDAMAKTGLFRKYTP